MAAAGCDDDRPAIEIQLSPVGEHDEPALFALYATVRTEQLAMDGWDPVFRDQVLRFQFDAQWRGYRDGFPQADTRLVVREGAPVGWMIVDASKHALHLIDIALLPAQRSQGIGTQLVRALQEQAAAGARPVRLAVHRFNDRALALYGRLGFSVISETDVDLCMEWKA